VIKLCRYKHASSTSLIRQEIQPLVRHLTRSTPSLPPRLPLHRNTQPLPCLLRPLRLPRFKPRLRSLGRNLRRLELTQPRGPRVGKLGEPRYYALAFQLGVPVPRRGGRVVGG
jgi:hypothetical protein